VASGVRQCNGTRLFESFAIRSVVGRACRIRETGGLSRVDRDRRVDRLLAYPETSAGAQGRIDEQRRERTRGSADRTHATTDNWATRANRLDHARTVVHERGRAPCRRETCRSRCATSLRSVRGKQNDRWSEPQQFIRSDRRRTSTLVSCTTSNVLALGARKRSRPGRSDCSSLGTTRRATTTRATDPRTGDAPTSATS
jgi:hypothetical protein